MHCKRHNSDVFQKSKARLPSAKCRENRKTTSTWPPPTTSRGRAATGTSSTTWKPAAMVRDKIGLVKHKNYNQINGSVNTISVVRLLPLWDYCPHNLKEIRFCSSQATYPNRLAVIAGRVRRGRTETSSSPPCSTFRRTFPRRPPPS